jgi:hypothetical protein
MEKDSKYTVAAFWWIYYRALFQRYEIVEQDTPAGEGQRKKKPGNR